MKQKCLRVIGYSLVALSIFLLFQNATLITNSNTVQFPLRNIDTRTLKMSPDGLIRPATPHIPSHDLSLDGRLGVLYRVINNRYVKIALMKPERVNTYVGNPSNDLVGAGLLDESAHGTFDLNHFKTHFPELASATQERTVICEKTEVRQNPYVCGPERNRDCYDVTLINRFSLGTSAHLVSVDVRIQVENPKTVNARIVSVANRPATFRIGPAIPFNKIAEPIVVGDNRLLIARAHNETFFTTDGTAVNNANIFYSVYGETDSHGQPTEQCDVRQWVYSATDYAQNKIHPIAHAHYDTRNQMKERYKFARYPFRDSLGNPIPGTVDIGGSYPWMDREAANLVFTSYGMDSFYEFVSGVLTTVYPEANRTTDYFIPTTSDERIDVEHFDRTMGVSIAGFWTHGKVVLLDGLINNVDYAFRVVPRNEGSNQNIDVNRKLSLYTGTPANQTYELVSVGRERGNDFNVSRYDPRMALNSTYLGSMENRFNYVEAMLPVTPRDVVWHFGTTKHTEEVVLDDYMTPYAVIFSEMTGAIGAYDSHPKTSKYYDGVYRGVKSPALAENDYPQAPSGNPALFQNAATAVDRFFKVPAYGKPIGDMRIEPIAKGGIHGKGAWFNENNGIAYKIPTQSDSIIKLWNRQNIYVGVFIDIRQNFPTNPSVSGATSSFEKTLFSVSSSTKILLARGRNISGDLFSKVLLRNGNRTIAVFELSNPNRLRKSNWYHLGFAFTNTGHSLYLNGYKLGDFTKDASISDAEYFEFLRFGSGSIITLGSGTSTSNEAIKGWYDDFRVHIRNPTLEEKCNYARGTLVDVGTNSYWLAVAARYPADSHAEVGRIVSRAGNYACYVKYGEGVYSSGLTSINAFAHLKNLPPNTSSVRNVALNRNHVLQFDSPRPDFSKNHFCLSCHVEPSTSGTYTTYPETDRRALDFNSSLMLQADPRRQPHQPPRWIRGVIPANYFGSGKPATTLNTAGLSYEVDQWILPTAPTPAPLSAFAMPMGAISASARVTRSPASAGIHSAPSYTALPCEISSVVWSGSVYERACGCFDLDPHYYPHSDLGQLGQSCYHKHLGPASLEKEFARGFRLASHQVATIANNLIFKMQNDGNLVLYFNQKAVWSSGTWGRCANDCLAVFQDDGNFVIYKTTGPWVPLYVSSQTWNRAVKLKISAFSPHVSALDSRGIRVWSRPDNVLP